MAQTLSDEACSAYVLSGVGSLQDFWRKKRDLSRSGDTRTLLDINSVQGLLAFMSVSVPCPRWLFTSTHRVLSRPAF